MQTIVQVVSIDETGDSYHRFRWPAQQLCQQDSSICLMNVQFDAVERVEWGLHADLLVLAQTHDTEMLAVLEERKRLGKKTLVEYNDNFYEPPAGLAIESAWRNPLVWNCYQRFMTHADGIIVTGPGLQQVFAEKVETPIHILPNHFPFPLDDQAARTSGDMLTLGWAGSIGHASDFLAILPCIRELLEEIPELHFSVMGSRSLPELVKIDPDRFRFTPWGSMEQYFSFWKEVDIGIAPLIDSGYNRCRSDIKPIEMTGCGAVPIVADALPYQEFIQHTGIRPYTSFDDLKKRVAEYCTDAARRSADAARCRAYVSENRIGPDRTERLELYRQYLGAPEGAYQWEFSAGYHEVEGTKAANSKQTIFLKTAQTLANGGQYDEAVKILEKARGVLSFDPEIALAELKCLSRYDEQGFHEHLVQSAASYPEDPRFLLFAVGLLDERKLHEAWQTLLDWLEHRSNMEKRFFQREFVTKYCKTLQEVPSLLSFSSKILSSYPEDSRLLYELAFAHETIGEYQRAAELLEKLAAQKVLETHSGRFLSGIDESYIRGWIKALSARGSG